MTKETLIENKVGIFLNTVIYENSFIFLNLWSVVHFFSGAIIYFLLDKYKISNPLFVIFVMLIMYEVFEFLLYGIFFREETIKDIVWDLIIAMIGALLVRTWL